MEESFNGNSLDDCWTLVKDEFDRFIVWKNPPRKGFWRDYEIAALLYVIKEILGGLRLTDMNGRNINMLGLTNTYYGAIVLLLRKRHGFGRSINAVKGFVKRMTDTSAKLNVGIKLTAHKLISQWKSKYDFEASDDPLASYDS